MPSICFYFQVHQPFRVKETSFLEIGSHPNYYDGQSAASNKVIFHKVATKCYYPANKIFLELLNKYPDFKISYSISGVFLEQAVMWDKNLIETFKQLAQTGRVEFINETYYHSLSYLYSKTEFKEQVKMQQDLIYSLFGQTSKIFRNTELIYTDKLAQDIEELGFEGILTEGVDRILDGRNPNFVYNAKNSKVKLLLKNYQLSDDIAFRFSNKQWESYPLNASVFSSWVNRINGNGEVINLFMDYETFGEHQWEESGIFEFLRHLPEEILKNPSNNFLMPSEVIDRYNAVDTYSTGHNNYISWADNERDLSAWRSNSMQYDALDQIYRIEEEVKNTGDNELLHTWRKLTTSDHFYYMCTKFWADGDVHKYFSPFTSPYEAYISFMNCFKDLEIKLRKYEKIQNPILQLKQKFQPTLV